MVVFTCGHCGDSLQKPRVEKHYLTKCRNKDPFLSCMDCFKDFIGNQYVEHTKCITEAERYSAKGFVPKENKGEKKQNTWIEMLQSVLDEQQGAPKNVLRIIETISKHNNTPRKKPKFINFVKNVCGHKTNPKDIDQAWDLISVKLIALSNAIQQNIKKTDSQNDNDKASNETDKETDKTEITEADTTQNEDEEKKIEDGDNGDDKDSNNTVTVHKGKKLSKKEKKEQKKRLKYEAELQSAVEQPSEDEEVVESKKSKKKTKSESEKDVTEKEGKKNKRKRQDTASSVNSNQEQPEAAAVAGNGVTKQKKKAKTNAEEEGNEEESMCLHDQNVAKIGELNVNEKFNWHAVIMSVLQKKGNELPFKRLQKKVLGEYSEITGQDIDDRIADKFIKKLKSAPNVRVDKNRVLLLQ